MSKTNLRAVLQQKLYQQQDNASESRRQGDNFKLLKFPQHPYHNLPPRDYTTLVGREAEVKRLLEWLSFEHPTPRIALEGMGGMGKTTLLLDVAHYCLQASQDAPRFESIIFTSAKTQQLTACRILMHFRQERTLGKIFQAIARTLPSCDTPTASFEEAWEQIHNCLEKLRTLLIVDNLETHQQQEDLLGFLYDLPATVTRVITSREPTPFTSTIRLAALPEPEAIHLIQHQAREKDIQLSLEQSQQPSAISRQDLI
ncbi:NB-ARC domain-containing protein [Trichocoleus sp. DQ-A3]|uniref:NB-ARC domain-containing protein n=1 Tax=Cyanophyceae TaxID=3028117 RepID=UPI0016826AAC|nr:AAA family ATPase [Coleofasciculus sp. FACHB-125]